MANLYARLYTYRERASGSQLENFLTEAFADIFNRLPHSAQVDFMGATLPRTCASRLKTVCAGNDRIEARTQVAIPSLKRPDIVVYQKDKPILVIEVKVHAGLQMHKVRSVNVDEEVEINPPELQHQLETYSQWVSSQSVGNWPGAVLLLTHQTRAPDGFETHGDGGKSVVGSTRTWGDVGRWLIRNHEQYADALKLDLTADFIAFLEENSLMTEFMTWNDIAATSAFLPSFAAVEFTLRTLTDRVEQKFKLKKPRSSSYDEFWLEGEAYWHCFGLRQELNPEKSWFFIGIGLCCPKDNPLELGNESVNIPKSEPFFFIYIGSYDEKTKYSTVMPQLPQGWTELYDALCAATIRQISTFDSDSDKRAEQLIAWGVDEIGKAVSNMPRYKALLASGTA